MTGKEHICWLTPQNSQTGGNWVDSIVKSRSQQYRTSSQSFNFGSKWSQHLSSAYNFMTHDDPNVDLWIENPFTASFKLPGVRSNDVIACHHIHYPHRPERRSHQPIEIARRIKNEAFLHRAERADQVVVVSDYWRDFLQSHGVDEVVRIRNGVPVDKFEDIPDTRPAILDDIANGDEPLVHLGIPANLKGTRQAYETLKDMDATFITTGRKDYELPVPHLNPEYETYLQILKSVDVVVSMSQFEEGWGLFAHEAMLAGTPVVGSGRGGMGELLQGGDQIICGSFDDLQTSIEEAIENRDTLAESGQEYVETLTVKKMVEKWHDVFRECLGD